MIILLLLVVIAAAATGAESHGVAVLSKQKYSQPVGYPAFSDMCLTSCMTTSRTCTQSQSTNGDG
jgi:hypothetical protein